MKETDRNAMKRLLIIVLYSLFIVSLSAQTMNEMVVVRQAELRQDQIVRADRKDRMGRVCAGLLILTDLSGLSFESHNGVVDMTHEPGRYMVFVSEGERVLDVYKEGFRPLEIILNQYGIYGLRSGQVYQLEITAKDREVDSLPVVFNVTPADARIRVGSIDFASGRPQQLPIGENEVIIEREGYRPVRETINVNNDNIQFNYTLQQIDLVKVRFRSKPDNAMIRINNADRGVTNRDLWLYPGRYEMQLILPDYITIDEAIEVTDSDDHTFSWDLVRNKGIINFNINPSFSELTINNQRYDYTEPLEFTPGIYNVIVRADRHLTVTDTIELGLGDVMNKEYRLIKNTGTLNITVTPEEAELFLNNEKNEQIRDLELAPGLYQIEVKADKHHSVFERVEIKLGETISKKYDLSAMTGNLLIEAFPVDAEIDIISEGVIIETVKGTSRLSDLLIGSYTLKAKASGYKTRDYNVTIKENETTRLSISLEEGSDFKQGLIDMIFVEGGTFQMGNPSGGASDERPVHSVTLSDFYIGKHEVSQKEYKAVMGSNPSNFKGDNLPVERVSWFNAVEFCNKLSIREGLTPVYSINNNSSPSNWSGGTITANWNANGYRLPTESEWEYAARGGNKSRGFTYSGSNSIGDVAWYTSNSNGKTHPVGTKRANELGLYDMSGNVWEWCWDWYGEYSSSAKTNPRGPANGSSAVLRGGWWYFNVNYCRVAYRGWYGRSYTYFSYGFRVARTRL